MSWIIFLIFGGVVGWVASLIMHTDGQQGIILNVIVGIVGAMIGNWIATQMGFATGGPYSITSFVVALIGAIILIAVVKMIR